MKTIHLFLYLAILTIIINACPSSVYAIPVFAKKYGFECTMCHSNFPRLNDYGTRYRNNGYKLPGREIDEKTVFEMQPPFAVRASIMYNHDEYKDSPGSTDVNQLQLNSVDLLSGGLLAKNLGYFLVFPPRMSGSDLVVAQPGILETADIMWSNPKIPLLGVRIGRFEPGYVAFSVKRSLTFSPYEIYDFASLTETTGTDMAFSDTRTGIEFSGYNRNGFGYTAGWTNGSSRNDDQNSLLNAYLHITKVFGKGEGQTAGQRIGILGYTGRAKPFNDGSRKNMDRFGLDASLNFDHYNLALQYLQGSDDKEFWGTPDKFKFSGGFAEFSYLPGTRLVGFTRYDWVNLPSSFNEDIRRWTVGSRFYLDDDKAIHMEFSHRTQNSAVVGDAKATENFFAVGYDFAL